MLCPTGGKRFGEDYVKDNRDSRQEKALTKRTINSRTNPFYNIFGSYGVVSKVLSLP